MFDNLVVVVVVAQVNIRCFGNVEDADKPFIQCTDVAVVLFLSMPFRLACFGTLNDL